MRSRRVSIWFDTQAGGSHCFFLGFKMLNVDGLGDICHRLWKRRRNFDLPSLNSRKKMEDQKLFEIGQATSFEGQAVGRGDSTVLNPNALRIIVSPRLFPRSISILTESSLFSTFQNIYSNMKNTLRQMMCQKEVRFTCNQRYTERRNN